jgi:hypothetical protein
MLKREISAPSGKVWTVRSRWPLSSTIEARTQGAYHVALVGWREGKQEFERVTQAIEAGELDVSPK